jgi:intraflagellar transport protein 140
MVSAGKIQMVAVVEKGKISTLDSSAEHRAAVRCLVFSPEGGRLFTGDDEGAATVWRADGGSRFSRLHRYPSAAPSCQLTRAVWMTSQVDDGSGSKLSLMSFFAGTSGGYLVYGDDQGNCNRVQGDFHSPIDVLEFDPVSHRMIVITRDMAMIVLAVSADARISLVTRTKLAVRATEGIRSFVWLSHGVLLTASGDESSARAWLVGPSHPAGASFALKLFSKGRDIPSTDRVSSVSFLSSKGIVALGTAEGRVLLLRKTSSSEDTLATAMHSESAASASAGPKLPSADDWTLLQQITVGPPVNSLAWCGSSSVLGVATEDGASVLQQVPLRRVLRWPRAFVQTDVRTIVSHPIDGTGPTFRIESPVNIKGFDATEGSVVVHNNKSVVVFSIPAEPAPLLSQLNKFPLTCRDVVAFGSPHKSADNDLVISATEAGVLVMNREGVIKHTITLPSSDGPPVALARRERFVAVATEGGTIKLLDVSRSDPKMLFEGTLVTPGTSEVSNVVEKMAISADGKRVAFIGSKIVAASVSTAKGARMVTSVKEPDSRVHTWFADSSLVTSMDCGHGKRPVDLWWDDTESRLLGVQVESDATSASKKDDEDAAPTSLVEMVTVFATPEGRLIKHDIIPLLPPSVGALGLRVPNMVVLQSAGASSSTLGEVRSVLQPLRDFVGLDKAPDSTKAALLEFSYQLALGNVDAAFTAVRGIDSIGVWRSMAQMCVKTRRLDVASLCLSNMGHIRGVRSLRAAMEEPEEEARIAMVAVQLGQVQEAIRLYKECGRFDLLNQLYQACGDWDSALEVARTSDRVHEKTTHYRYASHLESVGDVSGAMRHFEKAGTERTDVPRMLALKGRFTELREYVKERGDKELTRWLGQFALSQGNGDLAVRLFNEAGAALDLTRLLCMKKDWESAVRLVGETKDVPSAVHLARQFALNGRHSDAIRLLEGVERFDHAARIAMDASMDTESMTLALRADPPTQRAAAAYFKDRGELAKAVQLLRRGEDLAGALTLCFEVRAMLG